MAKRASAAFALGLGLVGIGLPDLIHHGFKVWLTISGSILLLVAAGMVAAGAFNKRYELRRRNQPPRPDMPWQNDRLALADALEEYAGRLSDFFDARDAGTPSWRGKVVKTMREMQNLRTENESRVEDHEKETRMRYFTDWRSGALRLVDAAMAYSIASPHLREVVDKPPEGNLAEAPKVMRVLASRLRVQNADRIRAARTPVKEKSKSVLARIGDSLDFSTMQLDMNKEGWRLIDKNDVVVVFRHEDGMEVELPRDTSPLTIREQLRAMRLTRSQQP